MLSAGAYSFKLKSRLAISLSWIAGYTNVIAFIMCGGVVVSHVTGNITHFGLAVADGAFSMAGAWGQVCFFGFLVLMFLLGALASGLMTETARMRGVVSKYMLPMAVEALLLISLAVGISMHQAGWISMAAQVHFYWFSGVAAMAMGLQNATITRISGAVIRTTHLTGVVTDFGLELVQYIIWLWNRAKEPGRRARSHGHLGPASRWTRVFKISRRQNSFQRLALLASVFGSFLFGVVAGTTVFYLMPTMALVLPVAFLGWIIYVDWRKPIADVKELDLTADPDFGGTAAVRAMLPHGVGIYRLTHHRRNATHHAPDFLAWVDRLPKQWRVVILAVSPMTYFDTEAALNLTAAVQKLRSQHRDLILCGVKTTQYRVLNRSHFVSVLGHDRFAPDVEFAVARAMNSLEALGALSSDDADTE